MPFHAIFAARPALYQTVLLKISNGPVVKPFHAELLHGLLFI